VDTTPDRPVAQPATTLPLEDVLGPLPRRRQTIGVTAESIPLPRIRSLKFKASLRRSLGRLLKWLSVLAQVLGGNLRDRLTGRDSLSRRAFRLRHGLEQAGGRSSN
jgi:hypothetical protein